MRDAVFTLCLLLMPAICDAGTLKDRVVTLNVETWDDNGLPFFISKGRTVKVGGAVEFALLPEGGIEGFDVVPVQVEISDSRIEFSYGSDRGQFWDAPFNGYVLRFDVECALFDAFAIDATATTMPVTPDHIRTENGALLIDVAGMDYGPDARLALDFRVSDCLLG